MLFQLHQAITMSMKKLTRIQWALLSPKKRTSGLMETVLALRKSTTGGILTITNTIQGRTTNSMIRLPSQPLSLNHGIRVIMSLHGILMESLLQLRRRTIRETSPSGGLREMDKDLKNGMVSKKQPGLLTAKMVSTRKLTFKETSFQM
jgi:hypothetical protein